MNFLDIDGVEKGPLHHNSDGDHNTAVGNEALRLNETGWGLTALGRSALYNGDTGIKNTALRLVLERSS